MVEINLKKTLSNEESKNRQTSQYLHYCIDFILKPQQLRTQSCTEVTRNVGESTLETNYFN